jgi:DUF4097 and DUF4098 domain-containing protein YvlB
MDDERMMILTMLQEEKISSEEAAKLLEALDEAEKRETGELNSENEYGQSSEASTLNNSRNEFEKPTKDFINIEALGEKLESIGDKINSKSKKIEATINKLGLDVEKGEASLSDAISDMINNIIEKNSLHGLFLGKYKTIEEIHEKNISTVDNPILEFQGINGRVEVYTWNKDSVFVEAKCQIKNKSIHENEKIYEVTEDDNKITFKPKYTSNIGIKLEVILPKKDYGKITLITTNGKIEVRDIKAKKLLCDTSNSSIAIENTTCDEINAVTKNGKILISDTEANLLKTSTTNSSIVLEDIKSKGIKALTKNGGIVLENIKGEEVNISTSNGSVKVEDSHTKILAAKTSNAPIIVDDISTSELELIELVTSNGKIDLSFTNTEANFYIDARTSMGKIDINFPLVYEVNEQKQLGRKWIIGHSKNENGKAIKVNVSTSNGSIKIN